MIRPQSEPSLCLSVFLPTLEGNRQNTNMCKPKAYQDVGLSRCTVHTSSKEWNWAAQSSRHRNQFFRIDAFKVKMYPKQKTCLEAINGFKEHSRIETGGCSGSNVVEVKRDGLQIKLKNKPELCLGFHFVEANADLFLVKC